MKTAFMVTPCASIVTISLEHQIQLIRTSQALSSLFVPKLGAESCLVKIVRREGLK